MTRLTRGPLAFAVGLALVTATLWAPALAVTGPTYEYRSAELVVETDDRFAVVYTAGTRRPLVEKPAAERALEVVSVVVGLALLGRRWRETGER